MKNKKSVKMNAVINVLKTLMTVVFPIITFPYISRCLQVDALGKYSFSASFVSYFTLLAALGISSYAIREGARLRDDQKKTDHFCSEMFSINIYSTLISYALLFICLFLIPKLRPYKTIILILSLEIVLTTFSMNWVYAIFEEFLSITVITFIVQLIAFVLLLLTVHNENDLIHYAAVAVISSSGYGLLSFFYVRKYVRIHFIPRPSLRDMRSILYIFITLLSITIYISSDTTILGWIKTDYSVGLYGTAAKIYIVVKQLLNALITVVLPRFSYYIGNNEIENARTLGEKILNILIMICVPAMTGLFCISDMVIGIYAGKDYVGAAPALRILSVALLFAVIANFYANCILLSFKKEKIVMIATAISASVNIILNLLLIPFFDKEAAAMTTVIAEFLIFAISYHYSKKYIKMRIDLRNLGVTIAGCVFIAVATMVCRKLIDSQILCCVASIMVSVAGYALFQILLNRRTLSDLLRARN